MIALRTALAGDHGGNPELVPSAGAGDGRVEPSPTAKAAVIDAAIASLWGERARHDRPARTPAAAASERVPIGSAGAASSRGSAEAAPLLIIPEPGQDEPGPGSASLLVALLAAEWVYRRRLNSGPQDVSDRGDTEQTRMRILKAAGRG